MIIASFEYSINFIDPLDVFVGYDDTSSCCEDFGWLFLPKPYHEMTTELIGSAGDWSEYGDSLDYSMCMFGNDEKKIVKELENYVFDTTTKVEDEGEAAIFRLIGPNGSNVYLHLYNYHNGYYAHGFNFSVGPDGLHLNPSKELAAKASEIYSGSL